MPPDYIFGVTTIAFSVVVIVIAVVISINNIRIIKQAKRLNEELQMQLPFSEQDAHNRPDTTLH